MKKIIYILFFIASFCQAQLINSYTYTTYEGSFDADYQVYLDRLTTLTYTLPSSLVQTLQNQLVLDLKSAGVWAKSDVISLFATDGDSNSSLVNLYPPASFQCTTVGTVTFSNNEGWYGNGTNGKVITEFNLSTDGTNFTLNNNCTLIYIPLGSTSGAYTFGCYEAITPSGYHHGNNVPYRNNSTAFGDVGVTTGTLLGIRRNNSTQIQTIDDASYLTKTLASSSLPDARMSWIGRDNYDTNLPTHKVAFGWIGAYLTDTEIADLKTALDTYYTSL